MNTRGSPTQYNAGGLTLAINNLKGGGCKKLVRNHRGPDVSDITITAADDVGPAWMHPMRAAAEIPKHEDKDVVFIMLTAEPVQKRRKDDPDPFCEQEPDYRPVALRLTKSLLSQGAACRSVIRKAQLKIVNRLLRECLESWSE